MSDPRNDDLLDLTEIAQRIVATPVFQALIINLVANILNLSGAVITDEEAHAALEHAAAKTKKKKEGMN